MTQKLEQQVQEVNVTNTNVKKGKVALVVGQILGIGGAIIPLAKCTIDTATGYPNDPLKGLNNLENEFPSNLIISGIMFGIGLSATLYGRIKHWYYNRNI
jgi:hypothetical protein